MILSGLYVITDGASAPVLLEQVEAALKGGARVVQYRDKSMQTARRLQEACALNELCRSYDAVFLVNDDVDLAKSAGAHGVHVGQDDVTLSQARAYLGANAIIGVSCYNQFELAVRAEQDGANYVAFGSMYASPTKPNAPRAVLSLLQRARATLQVPVCAIGGITLDRAPELLAAGADLLAVISDVFQAPDITQRAQAYRNLFI